ncbi:beta-1,6-N-acetylglucosaminyltransferase [Prevotella sp. 10(H)]|uniref:beta-1,6-N-acetylglucosaminyltransferase n=1 Tax=Prevotella sp. 10(H) TaxID=1158294 RepID=UPI0004A729DA|nr:beta-1,6-N-acetylglucosaminyltransferase [Prevotella sp. 10(H)]
MKQAILITAYKNPQQLLDIVDFFDEDFSFYIHIDNKSNIPAADIKMLESRLSVRFVSRTYSINWGSIDHLKAILLLSQECIKDKSIEYIHLITGQDFPVKTPHQITDYLKENRGTEFLSARPLPIETWKGGGLNRVQYYNLYEVFNAKSWQRVFIKVFVFMQKVVGYKRKLPAELPQLYGGSTYWTITREAVEYYIDFLDKNPHVLKAYDYTFCSEEILLHSILMNSPFKEKVAKRNLRFMLWENRDGAYPPNLDERDYESIINSDAFFARKFDYRVSKNLQNKIIAHLSGTNSD